MRARLPARFSSIGWVSGGWVTEYPSVVGERVWHHAGVAAILVLVCTGVLAVAAYAGPVPLALAVAFVQIVFVVGWFAVVDVPGARGGTIVAAGAAIVADVLLLLQALRSDEPDLAPIAVALALALLAAFAHQIARRGGRPDVVASITATLTVTALAVLGALLLPAASDGGSAAAVVAVVVGAGVATASTLLPLSPWVAAVAAVAVAAGAGAALGATSDAVGVASGAALGAVAAVLAAFGATVARFVMHDTAEGPVEPVVRLAVPTLLPVLLAAPAAYVLGRVLVI
jgi:hypothetical protein